jgi:hypothetical protein
MFFEAEVFGLEGAGGLDVEGVVEEDGAEHETLGVDVGGEAFLDGVADRHAESPTLPVTGAGGQYETEDKRDGVQKYLCMAEVMCK